MLDPHLRAQLDHAVGRQAEELHRAGSIAQHPAEDLFTPHGHARLVARQQRLTAEEEAGVHHVEGPTAPAHVLEAARIGANVCTMPPDVIRQLAKHVLTDKGLEAFLSDWQGTGQSILDRKA